MLTDDEVAALYDVLNPWNPGHGNDRFFHDLVMGAGDVLDAGCGTGSMLRRAREQGHDGRLVGLDPDAAMLNRARRHDGITWVAGTAAQAGWDGEFDLATMTGHAFQCLVTDAELRESLAAIRRCLRPGGRFAFDTRDPRARDWENWTPDGVMAVTDTSGRELRVWNDVRSVTGDAVTVTETVAEPDGEVLRVDRMELRFLDEANLTALLTAAGFDIEARYGSGDGSPVGPGTRELLIVARRA